MSSNVNLARAKRERDDEYYTRRVDIERELSHYTQFFAGKSILCNCDDPYVSQFFQYFALNFAQLSIRRLIAISYEGAKTSPAIPCKAIMERPLGDLDGDNALTAADIAIALNKGFAGYPSPIQVEHLRPDPNYLRGDFRSDESRSALAECDIVATNPPFSLFSEFISTIRNADKQFVVIGNQNAVCYIDIFPLLQSGEVLLGYTTPKRFMRPDGSIKTFGNNRWYTNLPITKRYKEIPLDKQYNPRDYPRYANYDAIDVARVRDIPCDYDGIMGVPISFIDQYSPDQFELCDCFRAAQLGERFVSDYFAQGGTAHISPNMYTLGLYDKDGNAKLPYRRLLIRNRHPEPQLTAKEIAA